MKPLTTAEIDQLPAACGWRELAWAFGIGRSRVFALEAEGAFDEFRLKPGIGPRRYSGVLLQAYLRGERAQLTRPKAVTKSLMAKAHLSVVR